MSIKISQFESDLLLANPETRSLSGALLCENQTLKGTIDQYDEMREACSNLLQRIGFNENYLPTQEGKALENLIDKLLMQMESK